MFIKDRLGGFPTTFTTRLSDERKFAIVEPVKIRWRKEEDSVLQTCKYFRSTS